MDPEFRGSDNNKVGDVSGSWILKQHCICCPLNPAFPGREVEMNFRCLFTGGNFNAVFQTARGFPHLRWSQLLSGLQEKMLIQMNFKVKKHQPSATSRVVYLVLGLPSKPSRIAWEASVRVKVNNMWHRYLVWRALRDAVQESWGVASSARRPHQAVKASGSQRNGPVCTGLGHKSEGARVTEMESSFQKMVRHQN